MDDVRCPYCVERDEFKIMTPFDTQFICATVGMPLIPMMQTTDAFVRSAENSIDRLMPGEGIRKSLISILNEIRLRSGRGQRGINKTGHV